MLRRERKRTLVSLIAVSAFLISMVFVGFSSNYRVTASTPTQSLVYSYAAELPREYEGGTHVSWHQDANSTSDEWTWQNRNWLFGPEPTFEIYHEDGRLFSTGSYAAIDEILTIVITIPKNVFTQDTDLRRVEIHGYYLTPDYNFSADFNAGFDADPYAFERWFAHSSQWNWTEDEGGPPLPSFMDVHPDDCSNSSDANAYYINLAVSFTSEAPLGLYDLQLNIQDTNWNSVGSFNFASGWEFRGISVGIHPDDAWSWSWGGSYTLQKLDLEGDALYSVSREKDFMMRFNVSGDDPEWVMIEFELPGGVEVWVNRTGYYEAPWTDTGGWVYDSNLGTYVWNASVEVSYMKTFYGTYQEREYRPLGGSEEVNVTVLNTWWNETTMMEEWEIVNETRWINKKMFYIYNGTTDTFDTRYGYTYYGYPYETYTPGTWNEEIYVFEPMPTERPVFYELNTTECSAVVIGRELVIDFVGHFTMEMPKTSMYQNFYWFTKVMGPEGWTYSPATYGENPRQTESEFQMALSISIESPVTIARLLREDGSEPNGWMFQVDKGDNFMVKGRLQGGGLLSSDIDGVAFSMNAHTGFWTEEESRNSELAYVIKYDINGIPEFKAFNRTDKYNYTYGLYMDWVYANLTGWHYEYNELTATWEWEYGEYNEWQWVEAEGWHWQCWYYNQLTGKWQEEYIQMGSAETEIPADFAVTSDFNTWVDGGDFYASFLVNMSETVADTNYWWNFAFMNRSWYEDYSSPYGEHEVMSWDREWVYSFDYFGEQVYVDPFDENQLAYRFLNGSLTTDFLLGKETPYIIIDEVKYPIDIRENYDMISGSTWKYMFYYDHFDPQTGKDVYYYELLNGTKIYVTYDETVWVYNATTTTGDSFLTAMEYEHYYYDGVMSHYYWMDINGIIHEGGPEYYRHNLQSFELYDKVEVESQTNMWYLRYNSMEYMNLTNFWWESLDQSYYMTDTDGTLYQMLYNSELGHYEAFIDGMWKIVSWPAQYYLAELDGSEAMLATSNNHRLFYTEYNGVEYEMPYPGANAECFHEMDNTELDGGKVPTTKSLVYNNNGYSVYNTTPINKLVDIAGSTYEVEELLLSHSMANGSHVWNATWIGFTGNIGTFDDNLMFHLDEEIQYYTNDPGGWPTYNMDHYLIELLNGTTWIANYTYTFRVFEYNLNGDTFYSLQEYPQFNSMGELSWHEYKALNGTVYTIPDYKELPIQNTYMVWDYYNGSHWLFDFLGETYLSQDWGLFWTAYRLHNATAPGDVFLNQDLGFHRIYEFDYKGSTVNATASFENIYRMRKRWGHKLVYGLIPIESTVYRNFHELVVGIPQWGMWGVQNWAINPDNGALDLDGNLETLEDQYYVQEEYSSTDSWTRDWDNMWVDVNWDPNATAWGDEMHLHSWMGLDTFTWTYEWNQTFYWYNADDMTPLSTADMETVKDIVLTEEGDARPGYWDISWMCKNVTWEDILQEAIDNGWEWMTDNTNTWTWLSFGVGQNYGTSVIDGEVEHWLDIGMHYEFSGLMLWEDTNENDLMDVDLIDPGNGELTHYLIPDSVDDIEFVTPGMAFGNLNASDFMTVNVTDEVTWGVAFYGVNGTVFPFTLYGYWGWYDSVQTGSDMLTFDQKPTKISIDELSFLVHFQGHLNETEDSVNNYAELKVDNYVGNWDVDRIGGRDNLENRSLALNYFADVSMSDFAFKANGSFADSETTVSSDVFEFETAGAQFAEMIMGGVTYDWGKNTTQPYDVLSYTTPVGTFRTAFESDSGKSAAAWSFSSNMFYVTIGFPEWEGYSVYQDPIFVGYVSARGTDAPGPGEEVQFGGFAISPTVPSEHDSVDISVDVFTSLMIDSVELIYWTDTTGEQTSMMNPTGGNSFTGSIPPFADGTQVYFRVRVYAEGVMYESDVGSYIVGEGMVTTGFPTTGPDDGPGDGLQLDTMVLLIGGALVLVVILGLAARRRR